MIGNDEMEFQNKCLPKRVGMAELANASVVHPTRDPGSNLGVDKIFSDYVCVGFEFKFVGR